ncbi:MAG: DUF1648 domain-containing protein [Saprospiraceae bacterium]|nr:DUF1648 domain-containing protein [Saprospiraceae bacterium]
MDTRPRLQLPASTLERMMDVSALFFAGLSLLLAIAYFPGLPDQIPTHFNASGVADDYGSKFTIFIIPLIGLVMTVGMIVLSRYPHHFNYLTKITPENAEFEYRRARTGIRVVNGLVSLLFLVITWNILNAAKNDGGKLNILFWVVFIAVIVAPPVLFFGGRNKSGVGAR